MGKKKKTRRQDLFQGEDSLEEEIYMTYFPEIKWFRLQWKKVKRWWMRRQMKKLEEWHQKRVK